MKASDITIAITVYSRRDYIRQCVGSALNQTCPVRVIVVEDCGPDKDLEAFVKEEFPQVEYIRNPIRRGLFGNWNACMELCKTAWLSILHDDDFLAPTFVESMLALSEKAPDLDLYCGHTQIVDEKNQPVTFIKLREVVGPWMRLSLKDVLFLTPFPYPGNLFSTDAVRDIGGFRVTSYYCGDWEMWANLIARRGAAQTAEVVAYNRMHSGADRGTNSIFRAGRVTPTSYVQYKRVLHLMPSAERPPFDREEYQRRYQIQTQLIMNYGDTWSKRLLRYHVQLLLRSPSPHWRYAIYKTGARFGGMPFVWFTIWLTKVIKQVKKSPASRPKTA